MEDAEKKKDVNVPMSSPDATADVGAVSVSIERRLPYLVIIIGIIAIVIVFAASLGVALNVGFIIPALMVVEIIIGLAQLYVMSRSRA